MKSFAISDGINITTIEVIGYENISSKDKYDKKWILGTVDIQGAHLNAKAKISLWKEDFVDFDKEIKQLISEELESAVFSNLEGDIKIELIRIDCLGHFEIKVNLKSESWNLFVCYQVITNSILQLKSEIETIINNDR